MKALVLAVMLVAGPCVVAQQNIPPDEKRSSLNESAVALDATGTKALEATLLTKGINGSPELPVTNVRMVIKNMSTLQYAFISGVVTFYEGSGVRCGESVFQANVLATGESFETDAPGIRIRCTPTSWRITATNLIPRVVPNPMPVASRLVIDIDGEQHPLQLDKPLTVTFGENKRTIVVKEQP